jgi:N-hydroxyarylamine O-acetyltransferase
MEIDNILERLQLDTSKAYEPNLETLQLLTKHYLLAVPYENLDFALNIPFSANILKIYDKIVNRNRGGICYESNTLFAYFLKSLGFDVKMILAKVEDLTYIGYDYPHLALWVQLNDTDYLVDVANGQNVREPMPLYDEEYMSIAENNEYKITQNKGMFTLLVNHKHKGWSPRYHFTKEAKNVSDFAHVFEGKSYHDFANHAPVLVTRALQNGRVTLTDNMMFLKAGNEKRAWDVSEENKAEVLRDYFNIELI